MAPGEKSEYYYHLEILEDRDDGRVHEADWNPDKPLENAPIEERVPIHQISKIFYTDSGRLLNIGPEDHDGKNPVLLLKRDSYALPPSAEVKNMPEYNSDCQVWGKDAVIENEGDILQAQIDRQLQEESFAAPASPAMEGMREAIEKRGFPKHLDPEWIAMEMFEGDFDLGGSSTAEDAPESVNDGLVQSQASLVPAARGRRSLDSELETQVETLSLRAHLEEHVIRPDSNGSLRQSVHGHSSAKTMVARSPFGAITTSLSLVEMLIRLTSLQEFQQASHLSIPDHVMTFFLEETSTTGLVGEAQWRARKDAKRRVGFDPYSDSPMEQ